MTKTVPGNPGEVGFTQSKSVRNEAIALYALAHPEMGDTEIGREFGLTRQRVWAIRRWYARCLKRQVTSA